MGIKDLAAYKNWSNTDKWLIETDVQDRLFAAGAFYNSTSILVNELLKHEEELETKGQSEYEALIEKASTFNSLIMKVEECFTKGYSLVTTKETIVIIGDYVEPSEYKYGRAYGYINAELPRKDNTYNWCGWPYKVNKILYGTKDVSNGFMSLEFDERVKDEEFRKITIEFKKVEEK